jgi:hypothetical protein
MTCMSSSGLMLSCDANVQSPKGWARPNSCNHCEGWPIIVFALLLFRPPTRGRHPEFDRFAGIELALSDYPTILRGTAVSLSAL